MFARKRRSTTLRHHWVLRWSARKLVRFKTCAKWQTCPTITALAQTLTSAINVHKSMLPTRKRDPNQKSPSRQCCNNVARSTKRVRMPHRQSTSLSFVCCQRTYNLRLWHTLKTKGSAFLATIRFLVFALKTICYLHLSCLPRRYLRCKDLTNRLESKPCS